MTPDNIPRLGPQCLSCKKRRTKCDSRTPGCAKCQRDRIECPGYVKKLKWNHYHAGGGKKGRRRTGRLQISKADDESEDSSPPDTNHYAIAITFPESLEDRETRLLLDASDWYNEHMLPQLMPAQLPFRRENHRAASWTEVPSVIRNLMLLLVKTAQTKRAGNGLDSQSELCLYRGRILLDLKCSLAEAASDPFGIVLAGIITFMGVDLQNPAFGKWNWIYHFNAAHRIIQLRGGFAKCFFGLPFLQGLLSKYMMLEIFSTSTCCTEQLSVERVRAQINYIPIILLREHAMLESGQLCPQQLLQAIIRTNILRCASQRSHAQEDTLTYDDILAAILDFDPWGWAERVCRFGLKRPLLPGDEPDSQTLKAWSAVGMCFKQATLLYAMISIRAPTLEEEMQEVASIQERLELHLLYLFSVASPDVDGSIDTQLWRFCLWPAVISAYVSVCWCRRSDEDLGNQQWQFRTAGATLKNDCLSSCADFMRNVAERKKGSMGTIWRWSDGFDSRSCAFVAC